MESYSKYNIEKDHAEYESFIEQNLDTIIERYHRAEQKYRNLYDNSPDLLRTINLKGIIIDCNQTYANTLGYFREEIIGASIFEHVAEDSLDALKDSFKTWKTSGSVRDRKIWLKRKDGKMFPTLLSATSLYDEDGNLVGSNTTIRDISEIHNTQKLLEEHEKSLQEQYDQIRTANDTLLETKQRYRSLYDNSPDLLRTIDMSGIITDCNQSYAENLYYSKNDIIGKSLFTHTAERSIKDMQGALQDWKNTGVIKTREIWLKRKDESIFPTLLSATNLYDKDGNLIGRIASLRNMTDIYTAKEEIEQQKIKRISDMGVLSARIAHDLKNPLSVIKNSIELMKMRSINLDDKTRGDYERIERAAVRISHQIEEVLEYVWPKPLELLDSSLLDIFDAVISKINVQQVTIDLPKADINIVCDASKMEIVFSNLILNSIQAMNGIGNLYIRAKNEEKAITIEIEDTGHGIPQDVLPKIFEPLFTTRQIGTGLGLVSCKSIVEKHGGSINIQTRINNGTTFIISLPKIHSNQSNP
ncbi:MAG: PAS domain S-box protein [Thaumarchaeota archaeon]|nr:PAS domain S-box protein [Nitrososphaerota archaeon]